MVNPLIFTAPAEPLRKARRLLRMDRFCIRVNKSSHLSKSPLASICASLRRSRLWPAGLPLWPARHGGRRFCRFAISRPRCAVHCICLFYRQTVSVRSARYSPVNYRTINHKNTLNLKPSDTVSVGYTSSNPIEIGVS